jgi:hypothetical protein
MIDLGKSKLTSKGMMFFPNAKWSGLQFLDLRIFFLMQDRNKIGAKGSKLLTRACMDNLRSLNLSILFKNRLQ